MRVVILSWENGNPWKSDDHRIPNFYSGMDRT
jgi:hypothetical protein